MKTAQNAHSAHKITILAGIWKRTPLAVIDADGLRPTPSRVRETAFSWLEHLLATHSTGATVWENSCVIDAFAGTGALGLEAASRGAAAVHLCEPYRPAADAIAQTLLKLNATQVKLHRSSALAVLTNLPAACADVAFLDPPFAGDWLNKTELQTAVLRVMKPTGLIYAEFGKTQAVLPWMGYEVLRSMAAGEVVVQVWGRVES